MDTPATGEAAGLLSATYILSTSTYGNMSILTPSVARSRSLLSVNGEVSYFLLACHWLPFFFT